MSNLQPTMQTTNDIEPSVLPLPDSFDYPNFNSVDGLALVGSAAQHKNADGIVLRLTPAAFYQMGSAWYANRLHVAAGFSTTFRFRLTEPGGISAADGFSFNVHNLGADLNVGEVGTNQQLSVQFETYYDNSIYVHNLGVRVAAYTLNNLFDMRDGNEYEVVISVSPKLKLSVAIGQVSGWRLPRPPQEVIANVPVQLEQFSPAVVGFGARTGGGAENHDILRWSFQSETALR
jgi:hypothetical protein